MFDPVWTDNLDLIYIETRIRRLARTPAAHRKGPGLSHDERCEAWRHIRFELPVWFQAMENCGGERPECKVLIPEILEVTTNG